MLEPRSDAPTSISLLRATSSKFSCCSRVLSTLSSVMQKQRSRASTTSFILANTTNLARYGTQISSRYNWDARLTVSGIWWQSASQNLRRRAEEKREEEQTSQPADHCRVQKTELYVLLLWLREEEGAHLSHPPAPSHHTHRWHLHRLCVDLQLNAKQLTNRHGHKKILSNVEL